MARQAGAREPRLADFMSTAPILNKPPQVITACRQCEWRAVAANPRIGAEIAYAHMYGEHGVRLRRQPGTPARAVPATGSR